MDTKCADDFRTPEEVRADAPGYLRACGFPLDFLTKMWAKGYTDEEMADIEWSLRQDGLTLTTELEDLLSLPQKGDQPGQELPTAVSPPPMNAEEMEQIRKEAFRLPSLVCASEVTYEPPKWLIEPYFQKGQGTLIQADPGSGKTAFICAVAACVSTGRDLLGIPVTDPGDVLLMSVEDDLSVLRGRLEANGADLKRCHFVENPAGLTLNDPEVELYIRQTRSRLVVFDPLQAFIGARLDLNRSNETRPELAQLFEMAKRNDCAVAILAHLGKTRAGKSPVTQSLGSVDIPAAMRSVIQLIPCPGDRSAKTAVQIKCSNASRGRSIDFRIGEYGGVEFLRFSDAGPEDVDAPPRRQERSIPYENEPLVELFGHLLSLRPGGGFFSYAQLRQEGEKLLGKPPFDSVAGLRRKLDNGLAEQLLKNDGILVTTNQTGRSNVRGVMLEASCFTDEDGSPSSLFG